MSLPDGLALNAWTGAEAAHGELEPAAGKWGARRGLPHPQAALYDAPADPTDWADPFVGYGVLLRDDDDPALTAADKAAGVDAPGPVRELLAARPGTVVLRWRPGQGRFLRRYFPDGTAQDPLIGLSKFGIGPGRLPRYVVIVGGPDVVPWSVQYTLCTRHAVGRLPLSGDALGNYVEAMLAGWPNDTNLDPRAALLWTVDHGGGDITSLMRAMIADPLAAELADPRLSGFRHVAGADATGSALLTALGSARPSFVATSSHGRTGPLEDAERMRATLGLPVDAAHATVALDELVATMPAGAIWYAQACCSAGGDGVSHYTGLLTPGTSAHGVVSAVAALGASVAPAALELLGRTHPVRAVLGHVEPTFDWTLREGETGQGLGHTVVAALSTNLFGGGQPLGYAFADYRAGVGELHSRWATVHERLAAGDTSVRETLTRLRLTALDRQSLVLLGDPTVTHPLHAPH